MGERFAGVWNMPEAIQNEAGKRFKSLVAREYEQSLRFEIAYVDRAI